MHISASRFPPHSGEGFVCRACRLGGAARDAVIVLHETTRALVVVVSLGGFLRIVVSRFVLSVGATVGFAFVDPRASKNQVIYLDYLLVKISGVPVCRLKTVLI